MLRAKELLHEGGMDPEFKEMASEQLEESAAQMESLEKELRVLLLPKDPNDDKNVIMEIRGGAGGEEAALLQIPFTACIPCTPNRGAGKSRC